MRKKISILIDSLKGGGAQKQSALLAKALSEKYEILFIIFDGSSMKQSFVDIINNNEHIKIKIINGGKLNVLHKVYSTFKKERPAIAFSYLPLGNIINGIAGKLAGVTYRVGGIRNSYLEKFKFLPQKLTHNHLLQASISNSRAGQISHIEGGQDKAPVFHIPNCYPLNIQPIERVLKKHIKIISVGRFVKQKNYGLAFTAVAKCLEHLHKSKSDLTISYDIVGYGELEAEVRQMITTMQLQDVVNVIINPPNINTYYEAADIYLCSSSFEGLSNSIMEAMSFSLPVVATNVGGNPELIDNNINGYITAEEAKEMAEKLLHLVNDAAARLAFGLASYHKIKDYFSERSFYNRYEALINSDFKTPLNEER